ncbi:MAG TPA: extracellular solute-binding protein [Ktedonobacteraceae bacterium]|jgi:multiple sugar transport system substrate-binding protein
MDRIVRRRDFLKLGGGALVSIGALNLAACSGDTTTIPANGTVPLQFTYWGSTVRAQLTNNVVQLYQKGRPHTQISAQLIDFASYWPKLATQVSGGGAPDLLQMDMRYVDLYVKKGLLLNLSRFTPRQIDLHDFNPVLLSQGRVNNTVYGIPLGANFSGIFYDQTALEKADVPLPEQVHDWTWDQYVEYSLAIARALGPGVYGSDDASGNILFLEIFVRQRGKELYTSDGRRGFDKQDIQDWLTYWIHMRKVGACIPPDISGDLNSGTNPLVAGKVAITFQPSNTIKSYQSSTPHTIGMYIAPTTAGLKDPGTYLKASQLVSASATTKYYEEAVSFINFLLNDTSAIKVLGIERGIPGSARAQNLLKPALSASDLVQLNLVDQISAVSRPKLVLDPPGAGEVESLLGFVNQGLLYGKLTIAEAAENFVTQTDKILERVIA